MTDHTVAAKAGPALYLAAASAVLSVTLAGIYLISLLFSTLGVLLFRDLGLVSLIGLIVAAPIALATSLMVRCQGCQRLLIPLVYDGKSFFSPRAPSAWAIGKTACAILLHRHAACPHCGLDAEV